MQARSDQDAVLAAWRRLGEREAIIAALQAERFDPDRNEVTIRGVRYSIDLFDHLGVTPVGEWIRIEKREGETLTLRRASAPDWPAEREALLSLLREVEWTGNVHGDSYLCPLCDGQDPEHHDDLDRHAGHRPDCRLAAALREGT